MELRRAGFDSDDYRACLELRRIVLREPLGLSWSEADLAEEERERHFGLWDGCEVVACLSIRPFFLWAGGLASVPARRKLSTWNRSIGELS